MLVIFGHWRGKQCHWQFNKRTMMKDSFRDLMMDVKVKRLQPWSGGSAWLIYFTTLVWTHIAEHLKIFVWWFIWECIVRELSTITVGSGWVEMFHNGKKISPRMCETFPWPTLKCMKNCHEHPSHPHSAVMP